MIEKVGVYGGSFNPVHLGHIGIVKEFIEYLKLDKLLIIPTNIPPHKSNNHMVNAKHRLNMCKIAYKDFEKVEISDIEIKRVGKSYTIDTLRDLKKTYKESKLFLIIGADMFMSFEEWREYKSIINLATICTVPRDDTNYQELLSYSENLKSDNSHFIFLKKPIMQVSSTEIRNLLSSNLSISHLTGEEVERYIKNNALYKE